ncbi:N-acyl amino acid synthase FeeM domain-containing protein [Corallococcus sp. M7]
MSRIDPASLACVTVKVAESPAELEAAARVLHEGYVHRGLISPRPEGVQVTPHLLIPSTVILVAKVADEVVGTVSLHVDSPLGVPSDKTFGDVLGGLRAQGRRLAEVGALCIARRHRSVGVVHLLNKMVYRTSALLGVDDMVLTVHPDVEVLYRSFLPLERVGERRRYHGLSEKALAICLRLRVKDAPREMLQRFGSRPSNTNPYQFYCVREEPGFQFPAEPDFLARFQGPRARAVAHLARLRPDVIAALSPDERNHLGSVLPFALPHPVASTRPSRSMPALAYS